MCVLQASSESESGIFCMSSLSDDDDMGWSHSWPSTAWHCFMKGKDTPRSNAPKSLGTCRHYRISLTGEQHLLLLQMQSSRSKRGNRRVSGSQEGHEVPRTDSGPHTLFLQHVCLYLDVVFNKSVFSLIFLF